MKDLYNEKIKVLAERNSWSLAHAKGFIDGETSRRRGKGLSTYVQVGIDQYCLGFRAGYYERRILAETPLTKPAAQPAKPSQNSKNAGDT